MSATGRRARWPLLVALAAGGLGAAVWLARDDEPGAGPAAAVSEPPASAARPCPPGHLNDDGLCIPVPPLGELTSDDDASIELLPGRPEDYGRYLTPLASRPAVSAGRGLGVFIAAPKGTPVTAIELEAQVGPAQRWTTAGLSARLLTLHRVERAGSLRTYALVYDGLTFEPAPGLADIAVGTPLGRIAGDGDRAGLGVEVRQLRRGVDPAALGAEALLLDSNSLACDARNVLPLKPGP